MGKENTRDFLKAYQRLKNKSEMKFSMQLHLHVASNEPVFSSESYATKTILDYTDEDGAIITIFTNEAVFSLTENNWLVHVGDDYVTFNSKEGSDTHFFIEFC